MMRGQRSWRLSCECANLVRGEFQRCLDRLAADEVALGVTDLARGADLDCEPLLVLAHSVSSFAGAFCTPHTRPSATRTAEPICTHSVFVTTSSVSATCSASAFATSAPTMALA